MGDIHKDSNQAYTIWLYGLSGAGKTTIAERLFDILAKKFRCEKLDGDVMRSTLSRDLGYSRDDRDKNIERAAHMAALLNKHGVIVLASFITPYKQQRELIKRIIPNCLEVFVNAPLSVCEDRDVKGHYKRARNGNLQNFTGISDPFEPPHSHDIELRTDQLSIDECVNQMHHLLTKPFR